MKKDSLVGYEKEKREWERKGKMTAALFNRIHYFLRIVCWQTKAEVKIYRH